MMPFTIYSLGKPEVSPHYPCPDLPILNKRFLKKYPMRTVIECTVCGMHWRLGREYGWPEDGPNGTAKWYTCPDLDSRKKGGL